MREGGIDNTGTTVTEALTGRITGVVEGMTEATVVTIEAATGATAARPRMVGGSTGTMMITTIVTIMGMTTIITAVELTTVGADRG